MKRNIILLTGNEIRHKFFASYLSSFPNINLKLAFHESNINLKKNYLYKKDKIVKKYIDKRNKSEKIFFNKSIKKSKKYNFHNIKYGELNEKKILDIIKKIKFDFIISYGCSIIGKKFTNIFKKKILNIHLGLSPYYKGSGTNFFPFVNKEIHFCGSTIMEISAKIDSGKILHQLRPEFKLNDDIHSIGNRIIERTAQDLCIILTKKKKLKFYKIKTSYKTRTYKRKDFNKQKLLLALKNINNNLIKNYLLNSKDIMEKKFPLKSQL